MYYSSLFFYLFFKIIACESFLENYWKHDPVYIDANKKKIIKKSKAKNELCKIN